MFQAIREFRQYLRLRAIVNLQTEAADDEKALADLVNTKGFACLKAMMIDAALKATAAKQTNAEGLATAVGILAICEEKNETAKANLKSDKQGREDDDE